MDVSIAAYREADWPDVWTTIAPAFRAGDSYPCDVDISEAASKRYWVETARAVFVARGPAGEILGTYYIRADQGGLGDHVCNCGYVVAERARGRGLGAVECRDSQARALGLGFQAMRFNLVVATNEAAIRAWTKCGMRRIGTAPKAFRHARFGLVDAHIMYKPLGEDGDAESGEE
ncbi:MAG: GNAT family N-acetyltransferase [Parvularculaceae bacterium]